MSLDTASPTLRLRSDKGSKTGLVPVHPGQGPVMKRQTRRITDCLDCWKRGWCFLFFEQRTDGTPHGIWLCSDCIDKRPLALHWNNVCDEHDLQLASAPNVVNLAEAASLAAGDRLANHKARKERETNERQKCIYEEKDETGAQHKRDARNQSRCQEQIEWRGSAFSQSLALNAAVIAETINTSAAGRKNNPMKPISTSGTNKSGTEQ